MRGIADNEKEHLSSLDYWRLSILQQELQQLESRVSTSKTDEFFIIKEYLEREVNLLISIKNKQYTRN